MSRKREHMIKRFLSIASKNWKTLIIATLSFTLIWAVVKWLIIPGYSLAWTGFGDFTKPNSDFVRGKTLWDWMQLFIIPIFLSVGVFLLNRSERKNERDIAEDRQREAALQSYLDKMSDLLLKKDLHLSENEEARDVARIRTLTILRGLDSRRQIIILQFLQEAGLIDDKKTVIYLHGVDLFRANLSLTQLAIVSRDVETGESTARGINLNAAILEESNLYRTNLRRANLSWANLANANLQKADLREANLTGAFLIGADLRGAKLSGANLSKANLNNAKLNTADLSETYLVGANLEKANLIGTNLKGALLSGAKLTESKMNRTNLEGAYLNYKRLGEIHWVISKLENGGLSNHDLMMEGIDIEIDKVINLLNQSFKYVSKDVLDAALHNGPWLGNAALSGVDMSGANLFNAQVDDSQLLAIKSLKGATMPDGKKHK